MSAAISATAAAASDPAPIRCPSKAWSFRHSVNRADRRLSGRLQPAARQPRRARHRSRCDVHQPAGRSGTGAYAAPFNTTIDYVGTVRGRVGYAFGPLHALCHRRLRLGHTPRQRQRCRRSHFAPRRGNYQTGWTAGARRRICRQRQLERQGSNTTISTCRAGLTISAASACRGVNVDPRHPSVQARPELPVRRHAVDRRRSPRKTALPESDDWNVHAQTTVLPHGLSRIPLALCGPEQPARRRPGPGDLDHDGVPRRAAVGRRRILFQSRARAGLWPQRHAGTRRLLQRRSAEGRRAVSRRSARSAITSSRPSGSAASRKRSPTAANQLAGQARHRPRHADRRPLRGRRFLRRQLLCQGSARRFHELGDVVVGRLRLPRRPAGLYPRRRGRAQPQGLGGARRPVPGADRAQQRRR